MDWEAFVGNASKSGTLATYNTYQILINEGPAFSLET